MFTTFGHVKFRAYDYSFRDKPTTHFRPQAAIVRLYTLDYPIPQIARRKSYLQVAKFSPGGESLGQDHGRPRCNISSAGLESSHGDLRHRIPLSEHLNRSMLPAVHIRTAYI
jgi:hypothetical protein